MAKFRLNLKLLCCCLCISAVSFAQTITNTTSSPWKSMQQLIASLNIEQIKVPYGNTVFFDNFPAIWNLPDYNGNKQMEGDKKVDNKYERLKAFFENDCKSSQRQYVLLDSAESIHFANPYLKRFNASVNQQSVGFKIAEIELKRKFRVFSAIYRSAVNCHNCEFPEHTVQNILFTVDTQNKIIDKLLISYSSGGDVGLSERFFYIDKYIWLKDFYYGELQGKFNKSFKFSLNDKGCFIKIR